MPPQPFAKQPAAERRCNWNEVVLGFDAEHAVLEAQRCIQCPAAPCITACPLHNDIPGALWLAEQGDFLGAASKFRETSTMPDVCGRICPQERLCEGACVVNKSPHKKPVAIGKLEFFVADTQRRALGGFPVPSIPPETGKRVAVVGAGPAGITVAEMLRSRGHAVTVFEAWPRIGGILLYGIPNFKLDKAVVWQKLAQLEQMGVQFEGNVRVGETLTVDGLLEQGYDAVFLGHGAPVGASPHLPGEDLAGVSQATDFLVRGNLPPEHLPPQQQDGPRLGQRVVVVGGGDTSMDCVRTAVRLGAQEVTLCYRRTEAEMPGRGEERNHAREEGVRFEYLVAPRRILGDDAGRVCGIELVRMELGEPDASGRRRPVEVPGSEFTLAADTVVLAVGYWADPLIPETTAGLEAGRDARLAVDVGTGATSRPGVFAGGDSVRGADLVVTAVADAKRAARAIHEYLTGEVWEANELED
ncbi:MAG: NAD(P)-dependent oxidoreductase [Chloroflexi bacterium]|nr:NAD(P)-dependent oxidoreductase [Chloroflexota bacterium]